MRSNLEPDTESVGARSAKGRPAPQAAKLGATARSFSILDHVATAPGPFGVLAASLRNDAPHLVLQRLVRDLDETCNVGTLLNGEVVYLDRVEAEHWPLRLHYKIGSRVPLHCSAMGKLLLALAPAPRRQRLLGSLELRGYTDNTITEGGRLDAELRQIRKEQVSFDREEFLVGVVCIAVPIIGKNGDTLAALAVQAPEARMNVSAARGHLPALRRAAEELAAIFQDKT